MIIDINEVGPSLWRHNRELNFFKVSKSLWQFHNFTIKLHTWPTGDQTKLGYMVWYYCFFQFTTVMFRIKILVAVVDIIFKSEIELRWVQIRFYFWVMTSSHDVIMHKVLKTDISWFCPKWYFKFIVYHPKYFIGHINYINDISFCFVVI